MCHILNLFSCSRTTVYKSIYIYICSTCCGSSLALTRRTTRCHPGHGCFLANGMGTPWPCTVHRPSTLTDLPRWFSCSSTRRWAIHGPAVFFGRRSWSTMLMTWPMRVFWEINGSLGLETKKYKFSGGVLWKDFFGGCFFLGGPMFYRESWGWLVRWFFNLLHRRISLSSCWPSFILKTYTQWDEPVFFCGCDWWLRNKTQVTWQRNAINVGGFDVYVGEVF